MSVVEGVTFGIQKQLIDERTASAEASVLSEADISLHASEEDVVTLGLINQQDYSETHGGVPFEDGQTIQDISSVAHAASTFSKVVAGDLNGDELAAIQKLADKITSKIPKNAKDHDKAAAALLYNWVASNIHYIAVYLSDASNYIPNKPDVILQRGYGDCKDFSTLLVVLLKAANIRSSDCVTPVIIFHYPRPKSHRKYTTIG